MIGDNMTEKSVPYRRLNRIAEELDGKLIEQTLINSRGEESKRIIIEYKETD